MEPPTDNMLTTETSQSPICLLENPQMGFIENQNVNYKQRHQYKSDAVNTRTKEKTKSLSKIQGQKASNNRRNSVLPRFKVSILI